MSQAVAVERMVSREEAYAELLMDQIECLDPAMRARASANRS